MDIISLSYSLFKRMRTSATQLKPKEKKMLFTGNKERKRRDRKKCPRHIPKLN
jgi:hypothetical protein